MSPRRSTRVSRRPERLTCERLDEVHVAQARLMHQVEPETYEVAMRSKEKNEWIQAMNEEMKSLEKTNTWELSELPEGFKPLGLKWVFKKKFNADGSLDRFKARVVVKGFEQKEGIDYGETFSPVIRIMESLRLLLALSTYYGLHLHQMDVKTAFLYGDLEEEIYVREKGKKKKYQG